jgi:predicted MFS family arabinose efflux permease
MGYKGTMAQYMTIPVSLETKSVIVAVETDTTMIQKIYMVAVVGIVVIPMSSDRLKERPFHIAITMAMGAACFAVLIATQNHKVQYVFLCFGVAFIYANAPLVLVWTSNIISYPAEKRAITQAFVNAMGNSASIYGSFLWPAKTGPKYTMGFSVTLAMLAACSMGALGMRYLNNKYPYHYDLPARRQDVEMPEEMGTGANTPIEKSEIIHRE